MSNRAMSQSQSENNGDDSNNGSRTRRFNIANTKACHWTKS